MNYKKICFIAMAAFLQISISKGYAAMTGEERQYSSPTERSFADRSDSTTSTFVRITQPHVGAIVGVSDVPGQRSSAMLGVDAGFQPLKNIGVGAVATFAGPTDDYSRTLVMGKASYRFVGSIPIIKHSYVSGHAGWGHDSIDLGNGVNATTDYFAVGPAVGFDQPIQKHLTVGVEARYLVNFTDDADNTFVMGGDVKYWF